MRFNKAQVDKKVQDAIKSTREIVTAEADQDIRKMQIVTKNNADDEHYGRAAKSFRRGIIVGLIIGIGTSIAITINYYEPIKDVIIKINNVFLETRQQQN